MAYELIFGLGLVPGRWAQESIFLTLTHYICTNCWALSALCPVVATHVAGSKVPFIYYE